MPVNKSEEFNYSLYKNLLLEDKKLIDEYIPKMMTGEVNSFMKRLIEHYKTQEDILEVNEEIDFIDFVEVFENYKNTVTEADHFFQSLGYLKKDPIIEIK